MILQRVTVYITVLYMPCAVSSLHMRCSRVTSLDHQLCGRPGSPRLFSIALHKTLADLEGGVGLPGLQPPPPFKFQKIKESIIKQSKK